MGNNPEFTADSAALYDRLCDGRDRLDVPVDFGQIALDVGWRNGKYTPVINELGPSAVRVIDPAAGTLQWMVDQDYARPDTVYLGTLQEWVAERPNPADSAFVFNMNPRVAGDDEFAHALIRAVRTGGWIVTSMMEPVTAWEFYMSAIRHSPGQVRLRGNAEPARSPRLTHFGPNCYIQFWQRT